MNNILDSKLKENGDLYIKEILEKVSPLLSEFELCYLDQSVIYDDNRKLLCKRILNDEKQLQGYKIVIETPIEEYVLIWLNKSVELIKNFCFGEYSFKEFNKIQLENEDIKITSKYQENFESVEYSNKITDCNLSFKDIDDMLKLMISKPKKYIRK